MEEKGGILLYKLEFVEGTAMRIIEYYLMPESGYIGEYDRKEGHYMIKKGNIADMIHDSKMLWGYDYDKKFLHFMS